MYSYRSSFRGDGCTINYERGSLVKSRESSLLLVEYLGGQLNIVGGESYWKIEKVLYDQRQADEIRGGLDRVGEISRLE